MTINVCAYCKKKADPEQALQLKCCRVFVHSQCAELRTAYIAASGKEHLSECPNCHHRPLEFFNIDLEPISKPQKVKPLGSSLFNAGRFFSGLEDSPKDDPGDFEIDGAVEELDSDDSSSVAASSPPAISTNIPDEPVDFRYTPSKSPVKVRRTSDVVSPSIVLQEHSQTVLNEWEVCLKQSEEANSLLSTESAHLKEEIAVLKEQLTQTEAKYLKMERDLETSLLAQGELESARTDAEEAQSQFNEQRRIIDDLQIRLQQSETLETTIQDQKKKLRQAKVVLDERKLKIQQLETDLCSLRTVLEEKNSLQSDLERIHQREEDFAIFSAQYNELRQSFDNISAEKSERESAMNNLINIQKNLTVSNEELQKQVHELQNALEHRTDTEDFERQLRSSHEAFGELEGILRDKEIALKDVSAKKYEIEAVLEEKEELLLHLESTIHTLEQGISAKSSEVADLLEQLQLQSNDLAESLAENERIGAEMEKFKRNHSQTLEESETIREQIQSMEELIQVKSEKIENQRVQMESIRSENAKELETLQNALEQSNRSRIHVEERLQLKDAEFELIRNEFELLQKNHGTLNANLKTIQEENNCLTEAKRGFESELGVIMERLQLKEVEYDQLKDYSVKLEEEKNEMSDEYKRVSDQLEKVQSRLVEISQKAKKLQKSHYSIQTELDETKNSLMERDGQIAEVSLQLDEFRSKSVDFERKLNETLEISQNVKDQLKEELLKLKNVLNSTETKLKEKSDALEDLNDRIDLQNNQMKELEAKWDSAQNQSNEMYLTVIKENFLLKLDMHRMHEDVFELSQFELWRSYQRELELGRLSSELVGLGDSFEERSSRLGPLSEFQDIIRFVDGFWVEERKRLEHLVDDAEEGRRKASRDLDDLRDVMDRLVNESRDKLMKKSDLLEEKDSEIILLKKELENLKVKPVEYDEPLFSDDDRIPRVLLNKVGAASASKKVFVSDKQSGWVTVGNSAVSKTYLKESDRLRSALQIVLGKLKAYEKNKKDPSQFKMSCSVHRYFLLAALVLTCASVFSAVFGTQLETLQNSFQSIHDEL